MLEVDWWFIGHEHFFFRPYEIVTTEVLPNGQKKCLMREKLAVPSESIGFAPENDQSEAAKGNLSENTNVLNQMLRPNLPNTKAHEESLCFWSTDVLSRQPHPACLDPPGAVVTHIPSLLDEIL